MEVINYTHLRWMDPGSGSRPGGDAEVSERRQLASGSMGNQTQIDPHPFGVCLTCNPPPPLESPVHGTGVTLPIA